MAAELRLTGSVEPEVAALFGEQLALLGEADRPIRLDLSDADVEDAVVTSMLAAQLRELAERLGPIEVRGAPQVVAHTLYRIGALDARLVLVEPREELGRSS